jgi:hypothetical protein
MPAHSAYESPNMVKLNQRAAVVAEGFTSGSAAANESSDELALYKISYTTFSITGTKADFYRLIPDRSSSVGKISFYDRFLRDFEGGTSGFPNQSCRRVTTRPSSSPPSSSPPRVPLHLQEYYRRVVAARPGSGVAVGLHARSERPTARCTTACTMSLP